MKQVMLEENNMNSEQICLHPMLVILLVVTLYSVITLYVWSNYSFRTGVKVKLKTNNSYIWSMEDLEPSDLDWPEAGDEKHKILTRAYIK